MRQSMWSNLPRIDIGIDPTYHVPDDLRFSDLPAPETPPVRDLFGAVGRFVWDAFTSALLMGATIAGAVIALYLLEWR